MKPDLLRHIANPIIDQYVRSGKLALKDAIEAKKLLYSAEENFKFSVYGGDPSNIVRYLRSEDFKYLVNLFKLAGAEEALLKILEVVRSLHSDIDGLQEALEHAIKLIRLPKDSDNNIAGSYVSQDCREINLDVLASILREKIDTHTLVTKTGLRTKLDDAGELSIRVTKQHIKIELKMKRNANRQVLVTRLRQVIDVAKEIVCV